MSITIGVDPGPERSAAVEWDGQSIVEHYEDINNRIVGWIRFMTARKLQFIVIEQPEARYVPASQGLLDTALWTGRFWQAAVELTEDVRLVKPREWHLALTGIPNASSAGIRAALIDRLGGQDRAYGLKCEICHGKGWIGRKHDPCTRCAGSGWIYLPGPMKGLTEHERDALALCLVGAK